MNPYDASMDQDEVAKAKRFASQGTRGPIIERVYAFNAETGDVLVAMP